MRRFDWMVAIALTAAGVGCDDETVAPVSPEDAGALLALAPELTHDRLTAELGLEPRQGEEFAQRLEALHDAMREAHEMLPDDGETASGAEDIAIEQAMARVHERHQELSDVLNDDQRERFNAHVHALMAEHHRKSGHDGPAHRMHEAARALGHRLHGSPDGAGSGARNP